MTSFHLISRILRSVRPVSASDGSQDDRPAPPHRVAREAASAAPATPRRHARSAGGRLPPRSMPPRGASASGGAKRVRKPAMKRGRGGGHASSGGAPKGGGGGSGSGSGSAGARSARARPGRLARAKIPRGDAAAHRQQAFFEVDEDEDDYAGRGARAAEDPELGGGAGGEAYDDLPDGFDDEEIDEDEAFTEEDERRYGDIAFESFARGRAGGGGGIEARRRRRRGVVRGRLVGRSRGGSGGGRSGGSGRPGRRRRRHDGERQRGGRPTPPDDP